MDTCYLRAMVLAHQRYTMSAISATDKYRQPGRKSPRNPSFQAGNATEIQVSSPRPVIKPYSTKIRNDGSSGQVAGGEVCGNEVRGSETGGSKQ